MRKKDCHQVQKRLKFFYSYDHISYFNLCISTTGGGLATADEQSDAAYADLINTSIDQRGKSEHYVLVYVSNLPKTTNHNEACLL